MSDKKTPNRSMRDRLVRAEAVEFASQFMEALNLSFCTLLNGNLSLRFDSPLDLPHMDFGKTVPSAMFHMVGDVEGFFRFSYLQMAG